MSLASIESAIYTDPAVKEVAVIAVISSRTKAYDSLKACVVLKEGETLSEDVVKEVVAIKVG